MDYLLCIGHLYELTALVQFLKLSGQKVPLLIFCIISVLNFDNFLKSGFISLNYYIAVIEISSTWLLFIHTNTYIIHFTSFISI